jgi:hypothetical protein
MKTRLCASLALAFSGSLMAAGVAADDKKEALDRIEAQTTRIEAQVGEVGATVKQVGKDVAAAVDGRALEVVSAVGATAKAVTAVQATVERLRGPANRVWVSPYWNEEENVSGEGLGTPLRIALPSFVVVLNTGNEVAHVGCSFFSAAGNALLDRNDGVTIPRGGTRGCSSYPSAGEFEPSSGWMIVHSDRPVLVSGWLYTETEVFQSRYERKPMTFFPVDCDNPAGLEFICDWARP